MCKKYRKVIMPVKLDLAKGRKTVAALAREQGTKVNLKTLADGRDMMVTSVRLKDGSVAKLLQNDYEVDVIVMEHGKVLAAKGTFVESEEVADDLASNAMCRIANYVKEGEECHCDFWA